MTKIIEDWRGTPINPGDLCVYGAPVGRSIAMVEAEVVGFTKSDRVNVRPIRRAYGGWGDQKEIVHVGADRLTIVYTLPPSDKPTVFEQSLESVKNSLDYHKKKISAIHAGVEPAKTQDFDNLKYHTDKVFHDEKRLAELLDKQQQLGV